MCHTLMLTRALAQKVLAYLYEYTDELHDLAARCVDDGNPKEADYHLGQIWEILETAEAIDEAIKEYDSGRS